MNVKVIRMWSGEDVVADLVKEGDETITVCNPIVAVPTRDGQMGFAPWAPLLSGKNVDLDIARKYIVYISETQDEIVENYTQMFSTIQTPSKKLDCMILTEGDAVYAANKFIDYYTQFNRIDDYLRFVKKDRVSERSGSLFDADMEFFDSFDMEPNDMNFEVHVVDTNPKTTSRYNQWLYSETLNLTASNAIEEAIPGRTHKWIVVETNTNKVVGVVRFGSPTINSKPRNDYFGKVLPLSDINAHFVMGFNIVPTQPFGFNYLGGKLLALLACSKELKQQFDEKYGTDLKYFETTSLYGTTKGVSIHV